MGELNDDLSNAVFKRAVKGDLGEFSLDSHMLQVLMELDGKKDFASVGQALNMNSANLKTAITKLYNLKLIEKIEKSVPVLDDDFMQFLSAKLSLAMGPIASVLIEDEIYDMGEDINKFPKDRAAELVDTLARQIPREEKRVEFQQAMLNKIKATM